MHTVYGYIGSNTLARLNVMLYVWSSLSYTQVFVSAVQKDYWNDPCFALQCFILKKENNLLCVIYLMWLF